MSSPALISTPNTIPVFEDRNGFRSCHVQVPDVPQRLPAIELDGHYYSFFRVEKDKVRSLELAARLQHRGDSPVLTKTPKGYVIWTLEPEAKLASAPVAKRAIAPSQETSVDSPFKILASRNQYQPCHIQVPDLDKRLAAILFEERYYSMFKTVTEIEQVVQLIRRLSYRGDQTIITKLNTGYAVWILEPDAILA